MSEQLALLPELFVAHLQVMLARCANIRVTSHFLHNV